MSRPGVADITIDRWLLLILLLVAGFLAFSAWTFYRAARESSAVIDRDYYSHGLRFNQTLLEQKAGATFGWQLQFSLAGRQLRIILTDHQQQPVTAARGTLTLSSSRQGEPSRLPLTAAADGTYTCQLPDALHGEQLVQIDFDRGGAAIRKQLLLALP